MLGRDWRLVDTGLLDGVANMAIDEALLDGFDPASSAPVLRLYGWDPPALSMGRFQNPDTVLDLARCRARGVAIVRRITGGGVIYHADELTYSLVCSPSQIPGAGSVKESYRALNRFLLEFYRGLGLPAAYAIDAEALPRRPGARTAFCFAGRESFDVLACGRKIGGNAQRRTRSAVFQHGSIPLEDRLATALGYLRARPPDSDLAVANLRLLGIDLPPETLKERLAKAFAETLGITLVRSGLTETERARAALLAGRRRSAEVPM
jgi:lipoyl(octanoyl) transferase